MTLDIILKKDAACATIAFNWKVSFLDFGIYFGEEIIWKHRLFLININVTATHI